MVNPDLRALRKAAEDLAAAKANHRSESERWTGSANWVSAVHELHRATIAFAETVSAEAVLALLDQVEKREER